MEHENTYEKIEIKQTQPKKDYLLPISILVAGVLISGSVIYSVGGKSQNQIPSPATNNDQAVAPTANLAEALKIGDRDVILGDPKAPVTFIEYGDYQCPFCGRLFTQVEPPLREEYIKTGKVKMVYRNFMINDRAPTDHESHYSAEAAECAKDQKKFWEYHDALFSAEVKDGQENNGNLNRALFLKIANGLKMDLSAFTSCIDNHTYAMAVQAESDGAAKLGVNGTPTNYINGQMVQGAQPYSAFKAAIEAALKGK